MKQQWHPSENGTACCRAPFGRRRTQTGAAPSQHDESAPVCPHEAAAARSSRALEKPPTGTRRRTRQTEKNHRGGNTAPSRKNTYHVCIHDAGSSRKNVNARCGVLLRRALLGLVATKIAPTRIALRRPQQLQRGRSFGRVSRERYHVQKTQEGTSVCLPTQHWVPG